MTIKGMNTAATLWCTAAVGSFAGAGLPLYAAAGTLVVLALHLVLRPASRWVDARTRKTTNVETVYRIRVVCERSQEAVMRMIVLRDVGAHPALTLQSVAVQEAEQPDRVVVTADVFSASRNDAAMEELTSRINSEPGVTVIRWEQSR
jgi:putative Mg2+ transporter-C (MgtC) family protein